MEITLPLDQMTIEEKLRVMEALWIDISRREEQLTSPAWHEDILRLREEKIKSGKEEYMDWEVGKKEIRNRLQ